MPAVDESSITDPLQQARSSPVSASSSRFVEDSVLIKRSNPFIQSRHQIPSAFRKLKRKAANRPPRELAEYFNDKTWITSTTWPLHPGAFTYNPYEQTAVEGWHKGKSAAPVHSDHATARGEQTNISSTETDSVFTENCQYSRDTR